MAQQVYHHLSDKTHLLLVFCIVLHLLAVEGLFGVLHLRLGNDCPSLKGGKRTMI